MFIGNNMYRFRILIAITALLISSVSNAGLINQTGNLLTNGSFESGTLTPVTGHAIPSAASSWSQWSNSGGTLTTELITNSQMNTLYNVDVIDGDKAFLINTSGISDGAYTFNFYHNDWDTNAELTLSAWVYTVSGAMGIFNGSNADSFTFSRSTTTGSWEFLSVTIEGGRLNNEPLLYALGGASTFIVDSIWLNYGSTVENPSIITASEPSILVLFLAGLLAIGVTRKRKMVS